MYAYNVQYIIGRSQQSAYRIYKLDNLLNIHSHYLHRSSLFAVTVNTYNKNVRIEVPSRGLLSTK